MTEKQMRVLSVVATLTAVGMYVSYIPQIQNNLAGNPGSPLQPLVAAINCTLWVAYGFLKEKRDYPVVLANAPGIILGLITFITSFYKPYRFHDGQTLTGLTHHHQHKD